MPTLKLTIEIEQKLFEAVSEGGGILPEEMKLTYPNDLTNIELDFGIVSDPHLLAHIITAKMKQTELENKIKQKLQNEKETQVH